MVVDELEDDLAVVVEVKGKGLVVIAGCAHAGIVNTVRHALDLTGARRLYALIGGFHLGGADVSEVVDPTVEAIRRWAPEVVVPMHCTGRAAVQRFEAVFGDAFESSSVGTTFRL
jgi:7,8-dihydropterin-6-yl-methyl-4-(beta-D-ribofuranosyl)aminobenzene 5'-phosphate synthase